MPKTVAIVGTLDTKGEEFAYLRGRIESAGLATLVIDCGVLEAPAFTSDISRGEVATAAGQNLRIYSPRVTAAAASPPWRRVLRLLSGGSSRKEESRA